MKTPEHPQLVRAVERIQDIIAHWQWYMVLGIGLILAGAAALYFSIFTTVVSVATLGILVLVGAVLEAMQAFRMQKWSGFFLHVLAAIVYGIAGFFMVTQPMTSALSLTLLIAALLFVSGVFKIIYSLTHVHPLSAWLLLNGIITVLLGFLIWKQWPASGLWVIGMFVGIDMIISGSTWIALALKARQIKR